MSLPKKKGAIVAIDASNLLISSRTAGQKVKRYSRKAGFDRGFQWIETFGTILSVNIYINQQESNDDSLWGNLWSKYKDKFHFEFHYCPAQRSEKSGEKKDNVDEHLIYDTKEVVKRYINSIGYFCLWAGDLDYSPLLWQLKQDHGIEIAFVLGSKSSFSRTYEQVKVFGQHPDDGKALVYYFSPYKKE